MHIIFLEGWHHPLHFTLYTATFTQIVMLWIKFVRNI